MVSFSIRILLTALQMAEVFTMAQLRQFWALQLEFLLCIICEILPSYNLIYQHLRNRDAQPGE